MQYTWQLALVVVPVYFIKHSVLYYVLALYNNIGHVLVMCRGCATLVGWLLVLTLSSRHGPLWPS